MDNDVLTLDPTANADQAISLLTQLGLVLSPQVQDILVAAVIFAGFLLLAFLMQFIIRAVTRQVTRHSTVAFDDHHLRGVVRPVALLVVATGLMTALVSLDALGGLRGMIVRAYGVIALVIGIVLLLRVLDIFIDWGFARLRPRLGDNSAHYSGLSRKVLAGIVWVVGGIIVLGQLGVEITPLITTLGLGSLAVALALQDTLANFFAGIYLMLDRPIKVGDYVRLDTGDEGFVDGIGWRSTRIRLWSNYIVVLPNGRLTSSVITNMVLNHSETAVYIRGGVGYLNDLDHVERVLIETAHEVMARTEGACEGCEPLVRYQEFGDSNINFLVILKVTEFSYQYVLKHEYIKAVHRRFRDEGIEIAWPVRQLVAPHPLPVTLAAPEVSTPSASPRV
jgi:small-conductance mechanosensitive channel